MIKILVKDLLHFDSGNTVNGEKKGRGYYVRGLFISRYKSELIDTMRSKFNGNYSQENKLKLKDEWDVIGYFNEISRNATQKTYEKKKPMYEEQRKATEISNLTRHIERLKFRINRIEDKYFNERKDCELRIIEMQNKIEEMKGQK